MSRANQDTLSKCDFLAIAGVVVLVVVTARCVVPGQASQKGRNGYDVLQARRTGRHNGA